MTNNKMKWQDILLFVCGIGLVTLSILDMMNGKTDYETMWFVWFAVGIYAIMNPLKIWFWRKK